MNRQTNYQTKNTLSGNSDIYNIKKLYILMSTNWYWFLIILALAISAAYFYNKYTLPTYRVSASMLIEEGVQTSLPGIDNQILEGFGLRPGSENLDNQILILGSRSLIRKTLAELPFSNDVYRKGLSKKVSFFPLEPLELIPGSGGAPNNAEFCFQHYDGNIFHLTLKGDAEIELDTFLSFGNEVTIAGGSFTILPHPELEDNYKTGGKIYFSFYDPKALVEEYRKKLHITSATKDGTILNLSLEGTNRAREIFFLDKLVEVYMRQNLEKKNHEANRIIAFIDEQLVDVSDSLLMTENQLQEFRSRNRIMDVSAQAQQIIDQAVALENDKAQLSLEGNYYEYLDEYLSKETNDEVPIAPASMGIEDPLLSNLMQDLAGLQAEYFSSSVGEKNPMQSQLELRIRNTKQSLKETLQGIKRANAMAMDENSKQIRNLNAQATGLPEKERQLLGFERKFNLNNVLYTFLLQKRAEAQIQKASNKPDNELIDTAEAELLPIAPNEVVVYLLGLLIGGGLPFLILLFGDATRNKISSEEDLWSISELPIVGHIPHSRLSYNTVVLTEPQSRLSEAFRSLRTRMEFFTREAKSPVILITSALPGDGKTFVAINLASAYSLAGKRTLIIGFDLRKPTLSNSFNVNDEAGLSSYLIGKAKLDSIIIKTDFPSLDIIPSGPMPPNPGELATSEKAIEMFRELRERYDFIIVDTAPIGAVSDNYPIAAIADANLMIVRHGRTDKRQLRATLNEVNSLGIKGMSFLINDVNFRRKSRYAYNYKVEYKY